MKFLIYTKLWTKKHFVNYVKYIKKSMSDIYCTKVKRFLITIEMFLKNIDFFKALVFFQLQTFEVYHFSSTFFQFQVFFGERYKKNKKTCWVKEVFFFDPVLCVNGIVIDGRLFIYLLEKFPAGFREKREMKVFFSSK